MALTALYGLSFIANTLAHWLFTRQYFKVSQIMPVLLEQQALNHIFADLRYDKDYKDKILYENILEWKRKSADKVTKRRIVTQDIIVVTLMIIQIAVLLVINVFRPITLTTAVFP